MKFICKHCRNTSFIVVEIVKTGTEVLSLNDNGEHELDESPIHYKTEEVRQFECKACGHPVKDKDNDIIDSYEELAKSLL